MGWYIMATNQQFLGCTGELGMEKGSGSAAKVSSKIAKEQETA